MANSCTNVFTFRSCPWFFSWSWAEEENREEKNRRQPDISLNCIPPSGNALEKTKEHSLIIPLNHIPSRNAPKKTKENRVFYSPESYTSFQKCSASIYWARKSCFTTLSQHWNTKSWNFLLTSSNLVSLLIITILTLMFTVFLRTIAKY